MCIYVCVFQIKLCNVFISHRYIGIISLHIYWWPVLYCSSEIYYIFNLIISRTERSRNNYSNLIKKRKHNYSIELLSSYLIIYSKAHTIHTNTRIQTHTRIQRHTHTHSLNTPLRIFIQLTLTRNQKQKRTKYKVISIAYLRYTLCKIY